MNHENHADNLYIRIHRLLVIEQYAEAERLLDEHLSRDPAAGEAILSWTELKLLQGQTNTAIRRLGPLTIAFPTDPYYMLAAAEVVLNEAHVTPAEVTELLNGVAACSGDSSDMLAKIGFAAVMRGFWSYGMRFFIKAMKARDRGAPTASKDLILLWKENEASLEVYLRSLVKLDGRGLDGDSLDDLPLEVLVRTICILFLAARDLRISEAWPIAVRLASARRELSEAWGEEDLGPLFGRFCLNWVGIELIGGAKMGPWTAN